MIQSSSDVAPLAVTMGDPAGIGPDILLSAWARRGALGLPPFCAFADPELLTARAHALGLALRPHEIGSPGLTVATFSSSLPVIPVRCAVPVSAGVPDTRNAAATIASIEAAVAAVEAGAASAVVTNPIAKSVLYSAGFSHPGHTEFLAALAERRRPGQHYSPVMMLACADLKVVPLTIHIPLSEVPRRITRPLLIETLRTIAASLVRDFGVQRPRIAVAGLNPHAGEGGTIGTEDRDIIAHAITELAAEGLRVTGPHSADTLFHAGARAGYDAVLAMYHDQALIPIKTIAFDDGVNVTLGLPFLRTSPDHGTAFDIAGTGKASPASFIAALRLAATMAARRASGTTP